MGIADGGSGGDPLNMAQNLGSPFGKIFRIDPLGNNSANKKYGIPADNPMRNTPGALPEIYAYGVRNPQRFAWDSRNAAMFMADIGQGTVEEISRVTPGANLGWNLWEGSYKYAGRQGVALDNRRGDPTMTYPIAEWGQLDPLLQTQSAAGGLVVYRGNQIPQLANLLIFADMPSGETLLRERGPPAERRPGCHPPHSDQRGRHREDLPRGDQGQEHGARQDARDTRGSADEYGPGQSDLPAEQGRWHNPGAHEIDSARGRLLYTAARLCWCRGRPSGRPGRPKAGLYEYPTQVSSGKLRG